MTWDAKAEDETELSGYEIARKYWAQNNEDDVETFGVTAIGNCGVTEVLYRHHEEVRHLRRIVEFDKTKRVLELGCGNGRWVVALAPLVARYQGVDFSPAMLQMAQAHVDKAKLTNVSLDEGAAQLYSPDTTFDIIYLGGISQYLEDEELVALLERLRDGLSADGVIIDRSTTHPAGRIVTKEESYFSIYRTRSGLAEVFAKAGFGLYYQNKSYPFLILPERLKHRVASSKVAALVKLTAPISFVLLAVLAKISAVLFKKTQRDLEWSHEFFLFRDIRKSNA